MNRPAIPQGDLFPPVITLQIADHRHCRFQIETKDGDLIVCGKTPLLGKPYCLSCCKIAYQPNKPIMRDRKYIFDAEHITGIKRIFG